MLERFTSLLLFSFALCFSGCGIHLSGAEIKHVNVESRKPSDVTIYVSVEDGGEPVGYLNKNNFKVYENGVLLDSEEVELSLLPRDRLAIGRTVLLLDLSASPSKEELRQISRGAAHFVKKVSTTQAVIVVAFDGSERPREVARYSKVDTATKRSLPPLDSFLSKDSSRDLNSALLAAIAGLSQSLEKENNPTHYGTVVSLIRGPDLAGRKTDSEVENAILDSGLNYFTIVPKGLKFNTLESLGKEKSIVYESFDTMPLRFQDLGMRVRAAWQSHYLVHYCSPARSGQRKLLLETEFQNKEGKTRKTNSASEFNADGFESGCVSSEKVKPAL